MMEVEIEEGKMYDTHTFTLEEEHQPWQNEFRSNNKPSSPISPCIKLNGLRVFNIGASHS